MTIRTPLVTALSAGLLAAAGCDTADLKDEFYGPMIYDGFPDTARGVSQDPSDPSLPYRMFELKSGFVNGQIAEYADFGYANPALPNVYVMTRDGKPVPGQHPIIDTLPDKFEYGSLWHVVEVEVPSDYTANDIKSLHGIERNGLEMKDTTEAMYCPVVNPDALWIGIDGGLYNVFFGTGEEIPNPYFDPNVDGGTEPPTLTEGTEADIRLQPVWHKRLLGFCFPGLTDAQRERRYPAVKFEDPETGAVSWEIDPASVGRRFDFFQPLNEETGTQDPWGMPPVFERSGAADDYSPIVEQFGLELEMPADIASLEGLDTASAASLGFVDNPILREMPIPTAEE